MFLLALYLMWQQNPPPAYADLIDTNETPSVVPEQGEANDTVPQQANDDQKISQFSIPVTIGEERNHLGLTNKFSSLLFSNHTGGVREISIHRHERQNKEFSLKQEGNPFLSISFEDFNGNNMPHVIPDPRNFKKISSTNDRIVYSWSSPQKLKLIEYIGVIQMNLIFSNIKQESQIMVANL